ncbi:MAG TPA: penicillin-binding protein 2 [Nevskiaceae bacterium]|nr:penicillin-binding protein 2 [Nevskiaceae bacterium]
MSSYDAIKDLHKERQSFLARAVFAGVVCVILSLVLVLRLVNLQLVQHDYYTTRAEENRTRVNLVPPVRGLIFDRNGVLLAANAPSFILEITPEQVVDMNDTLKRLGQYVTLTDSDISRFKDRMRKTPRYRGVPLRTSLSQEEVARYELNRFDFKGVEVTAGLSRDYPLGATAAHAIGYIGGITDEELEAVGEENYRGTNYIGKTGVEKSHEADMHGVAGSKLVEANAAGRPLRELEYRRGTPGKNLYLTLDAKLQVAAERALGDNDGSVIAIEPDTGEILALVSKPGFDPRSFVEGVDTKTYKALMEDKHKPLYNRALQGVYPPGSTIKPFMALAALEYNVRSPADTVYCPGFIMLPGNSHKYRCWKRHGHGTVDMDHAVAQSCDVYFYRAAQDLGIDHIGEFLAQFGLGKPTGIDIPNEKGGLLPTKEWKERARKEVWYPGETLSVGIGQGYLVLTPLQLAQATARMAARGHGAQPHLVHAIEDPVTNKITALKPELLPPIKLRNPGLWEKDIEAMQHVISAPYGTAHAISKNLTYAIAGKTGTAQVAVLSQDQEKAPTLESTPWELRDHAWFMAFAPADHPQIAVAVLAEHAGHGATIAAPVARAVMDAYLLGVMPGEVKPEEAE